MLEKMQQHQFSQHLHNEEPPLHHWLLPAFYEMNNLDFFFREKVLPCTQQKETTPEGIVSFYCSKLK